MTLAFTKMHALGNDFMVVDAIHQSFDLTPDKIQRLADRHRGVGFDQLLLVTPATRPECHFGYRIFNADGTESGQCGNGARCLAQFLRDERITIRDQLILEVKNGNIQVEFEADGSIQVNLGAPVFKPADIPCTAAEPLSYYMINSAAGISYHFGAVSMGNPHAVCIVQDVRSTQIDAIAAAFSQSGFFPQGVNLECMQVIDRTHVCIRVVERGVGETLACGSGAAAAMVMGRIWNLLDTCVNVELPGGVLTVQWSGTEGTPVFLRGPVITVYRGVIARV